MISHIITQIYGLYAVHWIKSFDFPMIDTNHFSSYVDQLDRFCSLNVIRIERKSTLDFRFIVTK